MGLGYSVNKKIWVIRLSFHEKLNFDILWVSPFFQLYYNKKKHYNTCIQMQNKTNVAAHN